MLRAVIMHRVGGGLPLAFALATLCTACNPREFDRLPTLERDATGDDAADGGGLDAGASDTAFDAEVDGETPAPEASTPDTDAACTPAMGIEESTKKGPVIGVRGTRDLGTLPTPAGVLQRGTGPSVHLGPSLLWTFPSTLLAHQPDTWSITAAYAPPGEPTRLEDVVDDDTGAPRVFLPRLDDELDTAINLVSTSIVSTSPQSALQFFVRYYIFTATGVGVARLTAGADHAERVPGFVFEGDTPRFSRGGFAHAGYVYLYSPEGGVARAPVDEAELASSYRAYNAATSTWVPELDRASAVLPASLPAVFSVSFNPYIGGFILVYSRPGQDVIELAQAPAPEGPFRSLSSLVTEPSLVQGRPTEQAIEQVPLRDPCGQQLVLSYVRPLEGEMNALGVGIVRSETRLMSVVLGE